MNAYPQPPRQLPQGARQHAHPHLRSSDPTAQEEVAPAKGEAQVIAGAQGHDGHRRRWLQRQLPNCVENPRHRPIAARRQDPHVSA